MAFGNRTIYSCSSPLYNETLGSKLDQVLPGVPKINLPYKGEPIWIPQVRKRNAGFPTS